MKLKKQILFLFISLIALVSLGRLSLVSYDSFIILDRQPYLQMQTYDSITVKWQSPQEELGCVRYGKTDLSQKACEIKPRRRHKVVLQGLEEGTQYIYRVEANSLHIDNTHRYFSTLAKDINKTQYIWLIGDSGKKSVYQLQVLKSMQEYMLDKTLDFWLLLGDNAYTSGTQKQYNDSFFEPFQDFLKTHVPWALNGNHDARRWAFYDIFECPTLGEDGGVASGTEKFYSIEQGDLHIVMIDSEESDLSKDSALVQWLEKDLKSNTKKWTIAAFHHPPYTDAGHDSDNSMDSHSRFSLTSRLFLIRENILPVLEKYDVDLVYSGHSHSYERSKLLHKHYGDSTTFDESLHLVQDNDYAYCKNIKKTPYAGTIYTVTGSSVKVHKGDLQHPAMPFSQNKRGSVLLEVNKNSITSRFINIDGEVDDIFTLHKKIKCR